MSARDRIFARIRRNLGDTSTRMSTKDARARSGNELAPPAIACLNGEERITQFLNFLEDMNGTYSRLSSIDELPASVAEQLRNRNLGQNLRMGSEPEFAELNWGSIDVSVGAGRLEEPATLTRAFCGSAETGTLMMLSGSDNPVTLNFLGETHFAVLKTSELEAGFEGMWKRLRASGHDPRTVNLITGPSRTADIEQKLELGAHGPLALHLFLIDDQNPTDNTQA